MQLCGEKRFIFSVNMYLLVNVGANLSQWMV